MRLSLWQLLPALSLLLAATASRADNCDAIRAQIDTRMRAGGLSQFDLEVVDAGASASGRTVGTCGNGARRIVFRGAATTVAAGPAASFARPAVRRPSAAASAAREAILTECLDGSMSVGGTCGR